MSSMLAGNKVILKKSISFYTLAMNNLKTKARKTIPLIIAASQAALAIKNPPTNASRLQGSVSGSERPPEGGQGNSFQHSRLESPVDRKTWQATVLGVAKSQTQLKQLSMLHNNSNKKNKTLRRRFNKRSARLIQGKLQNIIDRK